MSYISALTGENNFDAIAVELTENGDVNWGYYQ